MASNAVSFASYEAELRLPRELPPATEPLRPFPRERGLLSLLAHEVRAPLTALLVASEQLSEADPRLDPVQVRSVAHSIHRTALWLHGLVENLLCAATLESGRLSLHLRPVEIREVIAQIQPVVSPLLERRAQWLRLTVRGSLPPVLGDSRRIGQVLLNLLINASKFAPEGTPIDLTLAVQQGYLRVAVGDRGPGIPRGGGERLFHPFYRAELRGSGLGLGLTIVKRLVEAHGGRVGASNRRGGGARFWFELPLAPPLHPVGSDHSSGPNSDVGGHGESPTGR